MKLTNVTGFSEAKGVAKASGKKYAIGRLYRLVPIRDWETDKGRSVSAGFYADERGALDIDVSNDKLVTKLLALQDQYPCDIDIVIEPHPEDPLKNIIVDVEHPSLKSPNQVKDTPVSKVSNG